MQKYYDAEKYKRTVATDRRHGSPYDCGSADAYYGRPYNPHMYTMGTYTNERITSLSPEERAAYAAGYYGETERKEW